MRQPGHAKILEMVVYKCKSTSNQVKIGLEDPSQIYIGDLSDAYNRGVLMSDAEGYSKTPNKKLAERLTNQPPNLTLNVHGALPGSGELWAFAMVGIALQFVAVAIPALMTYYWGKSKNTKAVEDYAYPTFLLGTCLLVVSMALCSYIIEATTVEQVFTPTDGYTVKNVFRLQLEQNMGDQPFKAYVILNHAEDKGIRTSRYDPEGMDEHLSISRPGTSKPTVVLAVGLSFVGFICQFVGLRALHWSATMMQLGITLLMTCIRAWIRRGVSSQPITFQLDCNPNWIALSVGTACQGSWPNSGVPWPGRYSPRFLPWDLPGGIGSMPSAGLITVDDPRIVLRRKLQSLSSEVDDDLRPLSERLQRAMYDFDLPIEWCSDPHVKWVHIVTVESNLGAPDPHYARLELSTRRGNALAITVLHALLSLWNYQRYAASEMCVAKVNSERNWIEKRNFLESVVGTTIPSVLLLADRYVADQPDGRVVTAASFNRRRHIDLCAGLSIENMQDSTFSSRTGGKPLYGYLVVGVSKPTAHFALEVLVGFMDSYWQKRNLRYDSEKRWSIEVEGNNRASLDINDITRILVKNELVENDTDAKIVVVSSLARCTVWKDAPDSDELASTTDHGLNSSLPTGSSNQVKSLQRQGSRRNTSGEPQPDENPQDGATTPSDPEHRPDPAPSLPSSSVSGAAQAAESSRAAAIPLESSVHQPTATQSASVPSTSGAVQEGHSSRAGAITAGAPEDEPTLAARTQSLHTSETIKSQNDKGKHAATSSVP